MTSSTLHVRLVIFQRLPLPVTLQASPMLATSSLLRRPLAMIVCLLVPPATIRHLRVQLAASECLLTLLPTSPRLRSPLALPLDSPARPATPPPCWNSTQHPH